MLSSIITQIQTILYAIVGFFIKSQSVPLEICRDFYDDINKNSFFINKYAFHYEYESFFNIKTAEHRLCAIKCYKMEFRLYNYWCPIVVKGGERLELSVTYFPLLFNIEKLLQKTLNSYRNKNYFYRYTLSPQRDVSGESLIGEMPKRSYTRPTVSNTITPHSVVTLKIQDRFISGDINDYVTSSMEETNYIFTESAKEVCSIAEKWQKSRNWYFKHRIKWRRGILLHGKPGTGKSSLINEIGKKLQIPLYIIKLAGLTNQELREFYIPEESIVLIEDIDNIFNLRENLTKTQTNTGITFDELLNWISGVNSVEKSLLFVTTNDISKIDPALMRPGRLDHVIEMKSMSKQDKIEYATRLLGDYTLVDVEADVTSADFEKICVEKAMQEYWNS